ncbi:MAG: enoyl-CoA hydratase [Acidimicrobiaceae bacterium]|jgi:enoyl-CoA hydratase|nr:enoyl-CoA hydratase [Acidimicrobiaceae bacterium]HAY51743.1 crotonase/enoyl-CoA hydratase family protein [Acidimicrobiaceae bacterium]|tara:strand:+ start:18714 stop:19514 length:801 start_codon:yes stop_codon:yes gene_type:complete
MPDALVERDGHIMTVTLNRPKRMNAISGPMIVRMYDAFVEASEDDEVRCIIVTGADGNFSSGADLKAMSGNNADADTGIDMKKRSAEDPEIHWKGLLRSYRPTKPMIAAVEGVAIAGGTEILQAMDIRVAGKSAKFGISEARWSLYPMGGSAVRLPRQIPYTVAADLLLTGRHIDAEEAKEIGLIGHVVPDGEALSKAREIAEIVCKNGPLAVEAILKTLHETDGMTEQEALAHEFTYGWSVFSSEDAKEGPRAFSEKRTPDFRKK